MQDSPTHFPAVLPWYCMSFCAGDTFGIEGGVEWLAKEEINGLKPQNDPVTYQVPVYLKSSVQ